MDFSRLCKSNNNHVIQKALKHSRLSFTRMTINFAIQIGKLWRVKMDVILTIQKGSHGLGQSQGNLVF